MASKSVQRFKAGSTSLTDDRQTTMRRNVSLALQKQFRLTFIRNAAGLY